MKTFELKTKHSSLQAVEADHFVIRTGGIDFYNDDNITDSFPLYDNSSLEYVKEVE